MKAPRENLKVGRKNNGSAKLGWMMGNADVQQNIFAPTQEEKIAVAAYFRAEQRGFAPGNEIDDWLQAEIDCFSGQVR